MSLRDELVEAMRQEAAWREDYEKFKAKREGLARQYFEKKYGIVEGDSVFLTEREQEIKFLEFIQWSENVDDRPDILGYLKLPFGWSTKARKLKGHEWQTAEEKEGGTDGNK